jgi:6-phosphogluconolactonase (cycloisomerase 2 family)
LRSRLALLVPLALCAALQAFAAELTFQRLVAPGGLVPSARTVLSPDGRHLYAVSGTGVGGVAVYERDRTTGSLGFVEEHRQSQSTDLVDFATTLDAIVTPDGAFVIVTALRAAVYVFQRDASDGTLTFVERETTSNQLITAPAIAQSSDGATVYVGTSIGQIFVLSRDAVTGALTFVEGEYDYAAPERHFDFVRALAISPDGEFVYATSADEDAITYFARNSITGELTWLGDADAITDPSEMEFSPDGTRFFVGGRAGNAHMIVYDRNVATGAIDWMGDIAYAASSALPALAIEPDGSHVFGSSDAAIVSVLTDDGAGSFEAEYPLLEDGVAGVGIPAPASGISVSPDGRYAYATGGEGPIAVFAVATYDLLEAETDGVLTPGLVSVSSVALPADGKNLYATGAGEDAIQVFSRDAATGALAGSQVVRDGVAGVAGLDGVRDVVVAPNDDFVYAVSATDDAAVAFARNATGQLNFVNAESDGVGGANGLDGAFALAISPDGKNVYVASDVDDAVAILAVVAETGELSPAGFFQDGVGGVNGLATAQSVAVSPDGKHVYVGGRTDDAIAVFARDPFLGSLQFQSAVTNAALDGVTDVALSPDGDFLYATGFDADALVRFTRNPTTGALTNPSVTSHTAGIDDGLDGPRSVEISSDGSRLVVTGDVGSVLAVYRRDPATGTLKRIQAETDQARTANALAGVRATALSRDGRHLYAAAPTDDAVVAFVPEPEAISLGLVAGIAIGFLRRMGAHA